MERKAAKSKSIGVIDTAETTLRGEKATPCTPLVTMYVVQFPTPLQTKKRMHSMRIIQRNLVYIVGMVREDAVEEELVSESMFGKYGKITKIVINMPASSTNTSSSTSAPVPSSSSTVSLYDRFLSITRSYLTFEKEEEALSCIHSVNGFIYKGSLLRWLFPPFYDPQSQLRDHEVLQQLHKRRALREQGLSLPAHGGSARGLLPPRGNDQRRQQVLPADAPGVRIAALLAQFDEATELPLRRCAARQGRAAVLLRDGPAVGGAVRRREEGREMQTFEKIPREEPESVPTTVYFTADPDSVRTTYHKEIGEPINLNDLFDGASKTDDNHNPDHSNTDKEDSLSGDCKSPNQDTEDNLIDDIINYSSESNRW